MDNAKYYRNIIREIIRAQRRIKTILVENKKNVNFISLSSTRWKDLDKQDFDTEGIAYPQLLYSGLEGSWKDIEIEKIIQ